MGSLHKMFTISFLISMLVCSIAINTITKNQSIKDGETMISSDGTYELGFFSPGNSKNRYVGIWYKQIPEKTVVWVANREIPLSDKSGVLKLNYLGILVLVNGSNSICWSSNTTKSVPNPIAQLLDSGNLVVKEDNYNYNFLWESFDYPGNTLLTGMKFGVNLKTGHYWYLSSWKSDDDPSQGDYTYGIDIRGYPQYIMRKKDVEVYRSNPGNSLRFTGNSTTNSNSVVKLTYFSNKDGIYYYYTSLDHSILTRRVLSTQGVMQRWNMVVSKKAWDLYKSGPPSVDCDRYALCGPHGICGTGSLTICKCLEKFVPKDEDGWNTGNWLNGCVRRTTLYCHIGEGFVKYSQVKLPDTRNSTVRANVTREECERVCLENCSCMAFASLGKILGGISDCLLWSGDLIDIVGNLTDDNDPQDIYIRMALSELEAVAKVSSNSKRKRETIVILVLAIASLLLCLSLALYIWKRNHRRLIRKGRTNNKSEEEEFQLPLFDLATIVDATDNFSENTKLGEGGFGSVYKGMLREGEEIAVKRLSQSSKQGFDEFKTEVNFIAKLQHRNLVKLIGCCIQKEEPMLIYEYMPNKSLDFFIFDGTCGKLLDWPKRFDIINGISRGLLYLHQDSRLRIIHRDLKASNILLDAEMNPKISDFGLARSFGGKETAAFTRRVVGTHGYMSPEYAVDGIFSIKSDVFSFGVLVLEIISGKRNRGFIHRDHHLNLVGHAWKLHEEGRGLELVDPHAMDSCHISEILRTIHVALLCVQQYPEDRPNMSYVVQMLGGKGELPRPKQPGFFTERNPLEAESSTSREVAGSIDFTITLLHGR